MFQKRILRMREESAYDYDELKSKYEKWEQRTKYSLIFFSLIFASIFTLVISLIVSAIHSSDKQSEYFFSVMWLWWFIPGFFNGIIISVIPTILLLKYFLGAVQYNEFNEFIKLKEGADGKLLFTVLAIMIVGVSTIAIPLYIDSYIKIGDTSIVVDRVRGFEESVYPFDDIEKIVLVKSRKNEKGKILRSKFHEIHFVDGYVFSFRENFCQPSWKKEVQAMKFIADKKGVEIGVIDPYPKAAN